MNILIVAASVAAGIDWVTPLREIGVPIVLAAIGFVGGRKSNSEKRRSEFETLSKELDAFKNYRQLLIDDNNSLIAELREVKRQMVEMKEEIRLLSKSNCANALTCQLKS